MFCECSIFASTAFSSSFSLILCSELVSFLYFSICSSLIFIDYYLWELFQISWLVLETSKMSHVYSDTNGSLFRLRHRLWHVMLDVILITCLVVITVAWLVLNNWECLMCHEIIMFVSIKYKIVVFSFDALLGWLGTCLYHVMTSNQSPRASMII